MCGIYGFSRVTPVTRRIAPILAWEMAHRGIDAWGMTNGNEVLRYGNAGIDPYVDPPEAWEGGPLLVHNRGASFRDNANNPECAHPYTFPVVGEEGTRIIGVHNGVIRNHDELNKKYNRTFPVDSMHLFANLAEGKRWEDFVGWANVVWFRTNSDNEYTLHFTRVNDTDMHVYTLADGTLAWCSEIGPIGKASEMFSNSIKRVWKIEEYKHYELAIDENGVHGLVENKKEFRFRSFSISGYVPAPATYTTPTGGEGWGVGRRGVLPAITPTYYCKSCYKGDLGSYKEGIFCENCMTKAVNHWKDLGDERQAGAELLKLAAEESARKKEEELRKVGPGLSNPTNDCLEEEIIGGSYVGMYPWVS